MITYIIGKVNFIDKDIIIIENNKIGYLINYTNKIALHSTVKLYIYHYKTEYISEYYGFIKYENLQLFKDLINIKGIGCKFSFLLASNDALIIKQAIINKDLEYLTSLPKIGMKIAEKIINSYRPKMKTNNDLINTLQTLGYKKNDIYNILEKINQNNDLNTQIKEALKLLTERN